MRKLIVLQCFLLLLVNYKFKEASLSVVSNTVTINLPQGKIKGSYDWFKNQRKFLGIPYASVTERFREPGSPPSWNGTFSADQGNIRCNQYFSAINMPIGQEDCLVLNIFTPPTLEEKPYPVMVFIHGGGFYWGSNSELIYNPKYLVKKNVIVVTINYRLGAFGFLCLGLHEAPGNVGLKDQLAALKWIQNNIAYFGGDPNSVTIFGESVGASSVHYFLLSHLAKGLFHRAVMQSGSIMMPQAFGYQPVESASKVALSLGYNTSDPNELLKIFKNSSAYDIVKASNVDQKNDALAPYLFLPCMETAITNRRLLLTEHPGELLKKVGLNIPVIIGFNDREGIYWATRYDSQTLDTLKNRFDSILPNYLLFEDIRHKTTFIDAVIKVYFNNRTVTDGLIEYFTDSLIAYPLLVTSKEFHNQPNRTMFNYYFKYDSLRNLNKFISRLPNTPGACHGDELFYEFNPVVYSVLPSTSNDAAMINTMTTLWTSFAKTGEPSLSKAKWSSSGEHLQFLKIENDLEMITLPNADRMEFWKKTYAKYGRQ